MAWSPATATTGAIAQPTGACHPSRIETITWAPAPARPTCCSAPSPEDPLRARSALEGPAAEPHDRAAADIRVAGEADEGALREGHVVAALATSVLVDHSYRARLADQGGGLVGAHHRWQDQHVVAGAD